MIQIGAPFWWSPLKRAREQLLDFLPAFWLHLSASFGARISQGHDFVPLKSPFYEGIIQIQKPKEVMAAANRSQVPINAAVSMGRSNTSSKSNCRILER